MRLKASNKNFSSVIIKSQLFVQFLFLCSILCGFIFHETKVIKVSSNIDVLDSESPNELTLVHVTIRDYHQLVTKTPTDVKEKYVLHLLNHPSTKPVFGYSCSKVDTSLDLPKFIKLCSAHARVKSYVLSNEKRPSLNKIFFVKKKKDTESDRAEFESAMESKFSNLLYLYDFLQSNSVMESVSFSSPFSKFIASKSYIERTSKLKNMINVFESTFGIVAPSYPFEIFHDLLFSSKYLLCILVVWLFTLVDYSNISERHFSRLIYFHLPLILFRHYILYILGNKIQRYFVQDFDYSDNMVHGSALITHFLVESFSMQTSQRFFISQISSKSLSGNPNSEFFVDFKLAKTLCYKFFDSTSLTTKLFSLVSTFGQPIVAILVLMILVCTFYTSVFFHHISEIIAGWLIVTIATVPLSILFMTNKDILDKLGILPNMSPEKNL